MIQTFSMCQRIGRLRKLSDWVEATGHPLLILLYHHVGEEREWQKHLYRAIAPDQFAQDLDLLTTHFRPVSQQEVHQQVLSGTPFPEPVVWITFDDGLRSVAEQALPLLAARNIPCTLFVNPDFVQQTDIMYRMKVSVLLERLEEDTNAKVRDWAASNLPGKGSWQQRLLDINYAGRHWLDEVAARMELDWQDYGRQERIYLSMEDLTDLAGPLVEIGAHSLDHPMLAMLPEEEAIHQITGSMEWVQRHFRPSSRAFAFPFTDDGLSAQFLSQVTKHAHAPDLLLGTAGLKIEKNPNHLQRLAVDVVQARLMDQVVAAYAATRVKQLIGRYRIHR